MAVCGDRATLFPVASVGVTFSPTSCVHILKFFLQIRWNLIRSSVELYFFSSVLKILEISAQIAKDLGGERTEK